MNARQRWLLLAALGLSFATFAIPTLRSRTERDPVHNLYTDFLRYRYCSWQVLQHPLSAMTTPLETLAAQDPHPGREVLARNPHLMWEKHPCYSPGFVHVLAHAPFALLTETLGVSSVATTKVYLLLMLVISHFTMWLMVRSGHWWAALFLYPWLVRSSLFMVEAPLTFLFGYLSARAWSRNALMPALMWFSLVLSGYVRWIVWIPAIHVVAFMSAKDLAVQLRAALGTTRGKAAAVVAVVLMGHAVWAAAAVSGHFPPPIKEGPRPILTVACALSAIAWGGSWLFHRRSAIAPFALCFTAFLALYRQLTMFWYLAPLLAVFPLARTRAERVLWAATSIMLAELAIGPLAHFGLFAFRDLAAWLVKSWLF